MKTFGKLVFLTATLASAAFVIKSVVGWFFKKREGYYHLDGF